MTIKELREKEKLSQAKLANALGVSPSLIGAIETGKKNVSEKLADKVKDVYGVTLVESEPAEIAANAAVTQTMEEAVQQAVEAQQRPVQKRHLPKLKIIRLPFPLLYSSSPLSAVRLHLQRFWPRLEQMLTVSMFALIRIRPTG